MNFNPISPEEHMKAIERLMGDDDDEFDYERYIDHPIADEDWRQCVASSFVLSLLVPESFITNFLMHVCTFFYALFAADCDFRACT